jgi:DNA gyrase subunit A
MFVASTHDTVLCFSSRGKLYWLKVYQLPQAGRTARGKPIVNLLPLEEGERINAVLPVRHYDPGHYVLMVTRRGVVKKVALQEFSRPRASGIIAIGLPPDDSLVGVAITDGKCEVMLATSAGKAIRFAERDVRVMGRAARGVRGIRLGKGAAVISLIIVDPLARILMATQNGYGKRTDVSEFLTQRRGGQGVIAIRTSPRNGAMVGALAAGDNDTVMLISDKGTLVRTPVAGISTVGRNTQGVRLITLGPQELLVGIERVADDSGALDDDPGGSDPANGDGQPPATV